MRINEEEVRRDAHAAEVFVDVLKDDATAK